jgi:protein involved in polysaccharide export with SLBB domain
MNNACRSPLGRGALLPLAAGLCLALSNAGCYAPLHSHGIPARCLPDSFRTPTRSVGQPLNYSALAIPAQKDYILGPRDVLEVTVHGLYPGSEVRPVRVQLMATGDVQLPVVGTVRVGGMNLQQAQQAITRAYENGFIKEPRTNVYLVEKSAINVVVLGEVNRPGVYPLAKYENDVAHALASAGGLKEEAALEIEIHRRVTAGEAARAALVEQIRAAEQGPGRAPGRPLPPGAEQAGQIDLVPETVTAAPGPDAGRPEPIAPPPPQPLMGAAGSEPMRIVKIPLRAAGGVRVNPSEVILNTGDVVVVPSRRAEVFHVVGRLSPTNVVRFSAGERERELGNGFVLPRDRDITALDAVVMAGFIDPIESPTTVTVHRTGPDGQPLLILVDLIKARYDYRENVMIEAGDIVYLNPDGWWWGRRTFDKILPDLIIQPYRRLIGFGGGDS